MIAYALLLAFVLLCAIMLKGRIIKRKTFVYICVLVMAIVVGFRAPSVGEDTKSYLDLAESVDNMSFSDILATFPRSIYSTTAWGYANKVETFFLLFAKITMVLFGSSQMLLVIMAFSTFILFGKFILDNTTNVVMAVLILLCESIFMQSFNLGRQLFFVLISIQSYKYIKSREYKPAILIILFSSLFHLTSLLYALIVPIFIFDKKRYKVAYSFFASLFIISVIPFYNLIFSSVSTYYAAYFLNGSFNFAISGTFILWCAILVLIFFSHFTNKIEPEEYNLIAVYFIYLALSIIGFIFPFLDRISMDFRLFIILLIPSLVAHFKRKDKRILNTVFIVLLFASYFAYANTVSRYYLMFFS
ncbi:EpsG family protein [Blautia marasmi]|uniref:EpsG family protein n=1 Tax=Blautia marasmi TaxID=1917868 RepID=UPI000CF2B535|nr:EpsG family protein [Blautia marasmi]